MTRVVLAAAHLDSDPTNNRLTNLRALCQRCHLLHDRSHHLAQRWITYRRRLALGDLFLGPYQALIAALSSKHPAGNLGNAYTKNNAFSIGYPVPERPVSFARRAIPWLPGSRSERLANLTMI
jgi:hypothetical protein